VLLDISVTIQNKTTSYDSEGMPVEIWTASQTTERSNKQPLAGEIAFKEYGISDTGITNLFFFKTSTAARENGRIVYGSNTYDIYRVEPFGNHYEVIVRPAVI